MKIESHTKEDSPHQIGPAAEYEKRQGYNNQWQPKETIEPDVKLIFDQIRGVVRHCLSVVRLCGSS